MGGFACVGSARRSGGGEAMDAALLIIGMGVGVAVFWWFEIRPRRDW